MKTVTVFPDNKKAKKAEKDVDEIVDDFLESEHFENYELGLPLDGCVLGYLAATGWTFDSEVVRVVTRAADERIKASKP